MDAIFSWPTEMPMAVSSGAPWLEWAIWLVVFFGLLPGVVAYLVWAERKVAARFQDRIGPNRVGPLGLLQPIADAIKLITKEDLVPRSADRWVHLAAPVLVMASAFLVLAVIPFGVASVEPRGEGAEAGYPGLVPMDSSAGLLYLVAVSSLSVLGIFLAGWSSRNKYSLLGGMRGVAQLVSYEIPQVMSLIPVILWAGTLSLVGVFNAQLEQGWFVFSPPGLLAFVIFTIANIAETNRAPFDLPEADSEIIAGYHTEYSGMRFGLFFLGEYLAILAVSCLATAAFLGGGTLPFTRFPVGTSMGLVGTNAVFIAVFASKVALYVFVIFWIRTTLPRMRVDRLMNFAWKVLVPLCLINVLLAAAWAELAVRPGSPGRWVATAVTLPLVLMSVWAVLRLGGRRPAPKPSRFPGGFPFPTDGEWGRG